MQAEPAEVVEYFGGRAWRMTLPAVADHRGVLQPFSFDRLPFVPCRAFAVTDVPAGTVRGGHAHRSGTQLLVCLRGRIEILMRHRQDTVELILQAATSGLVFGPGVWCQQKYVAPDSVLLVFASEAYDVDSYCAQEDSA